MRDAASVIKFPETKSRYALGDARRKKLSSIAGSLLRRYVEPFVVLELMRCWNLSRCRPPLSQGDVDNTVNWVCGKELKRRGHR